MAKKTSIFGRVPANIAASAIEGALGGLGSATEGLLGAGNAAINYVTGQNNPKGGNPLPDRLPFVRNIPEIRKYITEPLAEATIGKEYLETPTFPEKVLQTTTRNFPISVATGGLNASNIARDITGTAAAEGAQELGAGPALSMLASLGAEKGYTKLYDKITRSKTPIRNLSHIAEEAENNFYKQAERLGSKVEISAVKYKERLEEIGEKITSDKSLSSGQKQELLKNIEELTGDIPGFKFSGNKYVDTRKQLNNAISKTKDKEERFYRKGIRKAFVEELNPAKSRKKKWAKAIENADAIHSARNFTSNFLESLDEFPKLKNALSNPLAYAVGSIPPLYLMGKDPWLALGVGAGAAGVKKASQVAGFLGHEAPRKVLLEAAQELVKRNIPAATRAYTKVNIMANDYEKNQEKIKNKIDKINESKTKHLVKVNK